MAEMDELDRQKAETAGEELPEATWEYVLNEEEIYNGLRRTTARRTGPGKDIARTVVLGLVAAGCIAAFIMDGFKNIGSLIIAALAVAVIVVLWVVPPLRCRHVARQMAAGGQVRMVCMFPDGLSFGGPGEKRYAYDCLSGRVFDDMVIWELSGFQLILLPRRALAGQEEWDTLIARLKNKEKEKRSR